MELPGVIKFFTTDSFSLPEEPKLPPFKYPTRCISCDARTIGCACDICLSERRFEICKVCMTYTVKGKLHEFCETLLNRIPKCTCCICRQSKQLVETIHWTPYGLEWQAPQFAVCQRTPKHWWFEKDPMKFTDICLNCFTKLYPETFTCFFCENILPVYNQFSLCVDGSLRENRVLIEDALPQQVYACPDCDYKVEQRKPIDLLDGTMFSQRKEPTKVTWAIFVDQ